MRLFISEFTDTGIRTIAITHGKDTLSWDAKPYNRASRIDGLDTKVDPEHDLVFGEINAFIESLSSAQQQAMWKGYKALYALFEANASPLVSQARYMDAVGDIYDAFTYEDLLKWASVNAAVVYPAAIKTKHDQNDPEALTYLKKDFFELSVMAMALRLMVPIWGEYIPRLKQDVSNTDKEYVAASLLRKTFLPSSVPYARLLEFTDASIEARAKKSTMIASALHAGLSREDFPNWLLSCTIVRRTAVVPLAKTPDGPNVITDVFQYVKNALMPSGAKKFSGPVTDKIPHSDDAGDPHESIAESYKMKQRVSDGDREAVEFYLEDARAVATALDPSVPLDKLEACLRSAREVEMEELGQHHLTLAQWILYSVVSPGFIPLITKPTLVNCLGICQALLWHWGFETLAGLSTAIKAPSDVDEGVFYANRDVRSDKISKTTLEAMAEVFPYNYNESSKSSTYRTANPGYQAVDAFHELLADDDWLVHAPVALLSILPVIPGTTRMRLPGDLREQTALLLVHLHAVRKAFRERRQA